MAIRLAIFDLDGTLIDSREDLCHSVNHALRRLGLPERSLTEVAAFTGEGAARLVARSIAPHAALQEAALALWWEHYQVHLLDHTVLFPGVADLLADAPCLLAVHTNKPGALARRILQGLGVLDRFAEVVGGDEAPRKPDPTGTRGILARLGAASAEALFVGDSIVDLETARDVPMPFLAVPWGLVPEDRLVARGASHFARSMDELRRWLGARPRT